MDMGRWLLFSTKRTDSSEVAYKVHIFIFMIGEHEKLKVTSFFACIHIYRGAVSFFLVAFFV